MLPRRNRLSRREFTRVAQSRMVVGGELGSLRAALFPDPPRFSVVISKKVAKSAVARNRLRRRIYAILHKSAAASSRPVAGIWYLSKGAETLSAGALEEAVSDMLEAAWLKLLPELKRPKAGVQ